MKLQMKKSLWIVIAALSIIFGGALKVSAQQEPIAGGYTEASVTDPEVVSAAKYAVRAEGQKQRARISLISIRRAEVQVVAGLNYRLGLRVNVNGKRQDVTAIVYKNLKRQYSLTKWEADGGGASDNTNAPSESAIEQLSKALGEAYEAKALGRLDADHPYLGRLRIVIEHSLADDNDKNRFVVKSFKSLEQAERWLKSLEREDGAPFRETRPLIACKRGLCAYNFDGGILHNHLYLKRISYSYRNGRPYIKTIYLLDGD